MVKARQRKESEDCYKFYLSKARPGQAVMAENCDHLLAAQKKR